jgi:hypothetical protein
MWPHLTTFDTTQNEDNMGWEERRGKRYYYRKRRVNGRVVSEYIGHGEKAEQIAAEDARERDVVKQKRTENAARLAEFAAFDQDVKEFRAMVDTLARNTFEANGYHQHKGQWRRKRGA